MDLLAYVPAYDPSGYSELCRNLLIACDRARINVVLHPRNNWSSLRTKLRKETMDTMEMFQKNTLGADFVTLQAQLPDYHFMDFFKQAHAHFVYSMFETDRAPMQYPQLLNNVTEVFVPSYHVKEAFTSSGIKNTSVIHPAIDADFFSPKKVNITRKYDNRYKFLIICDLTPRKGVHLLIPTFLSSFQNRDDVLLIIKAYWGGATSAHKEEIINNFRKVKKRYGNLKEPKIVFIGDVLTENQMADLINTCDCYVAPSYGEGLNLPALQAMSCGKPVIATNWGGHTEFIDPMISLPIGVDKITNVDAIMLEKDFNYTNHQWAVPSALHLARLMRWCHNNREEASQIGYAAREYVKQMFNYEKIGKTLLRKFEQYKRKEFI